MRILISSLSVWRLQSGYSPVVMVELAGQMSLLWQSCGCTAQVASFKVLDLPHLCLYGVPRVTYAQSYMRRTAENLAYSASQL